MLAPTFSVFPERFPRRPVYGLFNLKALQYRDIKIQPLNMQIEYI